MLLYHGTSKKAANNIKKHGVDLSYSRKNLDFGVGFYLTSIRSHINFSVHSPIKMQSHAIVTFDINLSRIAFGV